MARERERVREIYACSMTWWYMNVCIYIRLVADEKSEWGRKLRWKKFTAH